MNQMARPIALVVCLFLTELLVAQCKDPVSPPPKSPWALGPVNLIGILDGYYTLNNNEPGEGIAGLRAFDARSGQPTLSMAKISLDAAPAPIGFHLEAGFGKAFDAIEAVAPRGGLDGWKQIMQAYLSVKPKSWKGLQLDFGKFNTTVSAELTDPMLNFNYSRSILFALSPYYHTGIRATMPVSKTLTAGAQLVEGWNGYDGKNHGVTVGLTSTWTPTQKVNWTNTLYSGPEDYFGARTYRNFFDSALAISPTATTGIYVNVDYGQDERQLQKTARYYGAAVAGRYQWKPKIAFALRGESYRDADGFWTGAARTIGEVTVTAEYKQSRWLISRLEYRRDMTNAPYFSMGRENLPVGNQSTISIGMIAYFGPAK